MKQLIPLLIIILVSVISWSSCAKNKVVNITTIYSSYYPVSSPILLTTTLTTSEINSLNYPYAKVVNEHNRFFELSIMFNEKLQQIISLLNHSKDRKPIL